MTLILPDWLLIAAELPPEQGWGLRVSGATISAVGPHSDLMQKFPQDEVIDAAGQILLPGFVNAHTHLYGNLAHGIPAPAKKPTDFWSFLEDYWWPKIEDALDAPMIAAATEYACAEMVASGITSFYDILEAPFALPDALLVQKEIVERRGLRARLSFEATERAGPEIAKLGLAENTNLIDSCQPGDLVGGIMSWHTTFTCSPEFISEAFGLAQDRGVRSHAHVNEGVHEGQWCEEHLGMRTLEFYEKLGVTGPNFVASQCVQLSEREKEIVAGSNTSVTHMPLANCEVGGGIADMAGLMEQGVTVGLGSDGYINDFFEVMRGAFLLPKAQRQDPGVMPARQVLGMATEGGAKALGLEQVGRLEPGWAADLQLVAHQFPTPVTAENLADQLVLWRSRHDVTGVMVAGRWRVRDSQVLHTDMAELRARTSEQAGRLWSPK